MGQKESLKSELNKLIKQNGIKTKISELEDEAKECRFKANKHDAHLKELSSKLSDINKKSASLKTEREIKAIQIEEEIAKEQVAFANEEIERLENLEALKKEEAKKLEESLVDIASKISVYELSLAKDLQGLEDSKKEIYSKKEKLVYEINPKVYSFYQKIKRWAHTETVVPIVDKACTGCNIELGDSDYRKAIRSEEIMTCPNCGRILYIDDMEIQNG